MQGIFQQKMLDADRNVRVEYRFIPRTLYEEQLDSGAAIARLRPMFDADYPTLGGA